MLWSEKNPDMKSEIPVRTLFGHITEKSVHFLERLSKKLAEP